MIIELNNKELLNINGGNTTPRSTSIEDAGYAAGMWVGKLIMAIGAFRALK